MRWVDDRLQELVILLPDLIAKLGRVKADLVLALASDTQVPACITAITRTVLLALHVPCRHVPRPLLLERCSLGQIAGLNVRQILCPCCETSDA